MIRRRGDEYLLAPFKSRNGVLVNGNALSGEVVLQDHDKIEVGDTALRFQAVDDPDRTNALDEYKVADRRAREDQTLADQG